MKGLAAFITRGLWQAGSCALVFAFLPLLSWVAIVIVALISLRQGMRQGFLVLLWACLPSVVLAVLGWHGSGIQAGYVVLTTLLVWFIASFLRQSNWSLALQAMSAIGILAVLGLHSFYPDLISQLQQYMQQSLAQMPLSDSDKQQLMVVWSKNLVRMLALSLLSFACLCLVLARWWQSVVFNPGQLQPELRAIRLSRLASLVLLGLLVAAWLFPRDWLSDCVLLALLPFTLAGLSLLHSYAKAKNWHRAYLIGFYIGWIVFIGIMSLFLAVLAVTDAWFNWRCHWQQMRSK